MKLVIFAVFVVIVVGACRPAAVDPTASTASVSAAAESGFAEAAAIPVSAAGTDAAEPAIAADAAGNAFVVFVEHRADRSADLYIRSFDAQLKPFGHNVRVNPEPGEVRSWAGDTPSVAVAPEGAIYVGWNRKSKAGRGNDLMVSISRDGGLSFEQPVKINDDTEPASHGMHSLAIDKDGRVIAAWLDERNVKTSGHTAPASTHEMAEPNSEVFVAVSSDGGRTFSPNKKIASDVCPCCKTAIAIAPDGEVYVSWRQVVKGEMRHIAVASSADAGATFSEPVIVSDDQWELYACPVSGAALFAGTDKRLKVLWYTAGKAGEPGLYSAESTDGGKTFSPRTLVSSEGMAGTPWIGRDTQIFQTGEGKLAVRTAGQPDRTIEGEVPAVTIADGKPLIAFLKKTNDERSVWISRG